MRKWKIRLSKVLGWVLMAALLCPVWPRQAAADPVSPPVFPIGFAAAEGYSQGDVVGQPSAGTEWTTNITDSTVLFAVSDNLGRSGGPAIVAPSTNPTLTGSKRVSYSPTIGELGVSSKTGISVNYGFDLRMDHGAGGDGTVIWRIKVGTGTNQAQNALSLEVRSNGKMTYITQGDPLTRKFVTVDEATGGTVFPDGEWIHVDGALNYTAHTFTLNVNGIAQMNTEGNPTIPFMTPELDNFDSVIIENAVGGSNAQYRPIALDNVMLLGENAFVPVQSVTATPSTLSLTEGESATVAAAVNPTDATYRHVYWTSDAPSVATVDQAGTVTAAGEGNAVITAASYDGVHSAAVTVSVAPLPSAPAYVTYPYDFEDGMPTGWNTEGSAGSQWGVIQDPDNSANHVFARTNPAYSESAPDDDVSFLYAFGKSSWSDYIIQAGVKPSSPALSNNAIRYGLMGRFISAESDNVLNNRKLQFVYPYSNGYRTYVASTGTGGYYADYPWGEDAPDPSGQWTTFFSKFEAGRNYFAVNGQVATVPDQRYTQDVYTLSGDHALWVLGGSHNQAKIDDAGLPTSQLSPQGKVGFAEKNGWAYYDNLTVRVKERITGLRALAGDGTDLDNQTLKLGQSVTLNAWGEVLHPFDGISERQIDTNLTQIDWASSNPASVSVSGDGTIKALAAGQSIITFSIDGFPEWEGQLLIHVDDQAMEKHLEGIDIQDYGTVVSGKEVGMFPYDVLDIARLLRVNAVYNDGTTYGNKIYEDVSGSISYQLDPSDGSDDKAELNNGQLTLTSQAVPGDLIHLDVTYEEGQTTVSDILTVQVKAAIPIDVIATNPFNGVIFLDKTLNLDTYLRVLTGSKAAAGERVGEFGEVTGFVDFSIKHGGDVAELNGSVLSLKTGAKARDSIVVGISYTDEEAGVAKTLTTDFPIQVVTALQSGGENPYDETLVNGATPNDVLQGMQITAGPKILANPAGLYQQGASIGSPLPMLNGQTLNLAKDVKVVGYYDNPNNNTNLTDQVTWSVGSSGGAAAAGQIALNSAGEPVFSFNNPGSASPAGEAVIQASYNGVTQSFTVVGIHPDQLVADSPEVDLLPGESLSLMDNERVKVAGSYQGTEYRIAVPGEIAWTLDPVDSAKAELDGSEMKLTGAGTGDTIHLTAVYTEDSTLTQTVTVHVVSELQVDLDTTQFQSYGNKGAGYNFHRWADNSSGYTDPDLISLTQPLHPSFIRFPGGTNNGYYHWEIGGYIPEAMSGKTQYQSMIDDANDNMAYSLDDFMSYVQAVGAEPIVQINVYTADVDSAVAELEYAISKGYNIKYWELGNEMHLQGGAGAPFRNAFPTVQDYARKAKEIAVAMKAVDPTIKILVTGERYLGAQGREADEPFMLRWSEGLQADASYYDIVVNHWYWLMNKYYPMDQPYPDEVHEVLTRASGMVAYYAEQAAEHHPGKPVAFTEWGIQPEGSYKTNKTLLNGLFDADVLLNMTKYDNIALANRHVLVANYYELIGFTGKPTDNTHVPVRRATYYPFELLGTLFANTDERADVDLANSKMLTPESDDDALVPELDVTAFRHSSDGKVYLAVINKGRTDKPIQLNIDGQNYQGAATMRYVTGGTLTDGNGDDSYTLQRNNGGNTYTGSDFIAPKPTDGTQEVTLQEQSIATGQSIVIPRYSVAVIELQ